MCDFIGSLIDIIVSILSVLSPELGCNVGDFLSDFTASLTDCRIKPDCGG